MEKRGEEEGTTTLSLLSPEDVPFAADRLSVSDRFGSSENYGSSHFSPLFADFKIGEAIVWSNARRLCAGILLLPSYLCG